VSGASDVVVVGGGAIGVCVALEAARRGARATLLERGPELAWGCSAGNAGLICPSHAAPLATPAALRQGLRWIARPDSPFYLRPRPAVVPWIARFISASTNARAHAASLVIRELASASLALHVELSASGIDSALTRRGALNVHETASGFAEARREAAEAQANGLAAEVLDGAGALEHVPSIAGSIAGAVYYPGDAHCDPLRFVRAVGEAAAQAGVRIRTGVEVLGLRRRSAHVGAVETTEGDVAAGEIVLAAGAWTPTLARDLGVALPVEGGKGYHVDLEPGAGDPSLPVWFQESRVIVTPLPGRVRLAGTLELAGLDMSVDRRRVAAVERGGRRGIRGLENRRTVEIWRGLRPCSPDGLPIIGRPDSLENVVLATGHGMMGLSLAPITGRLVGEVLSAEPPSHDLAPVSPGRFRSFLGL
jgi:D-amino-acid dehydrogenase